MLDASEIKKQIKGEVSDTVADLEKYSHDASIFEILPKVIVSPKDSEDIRTLVTLVAREKEKDPSLSITARSGGTDMSGGAINDSIIMDFTAHLNRIIEVKNNPLPTPHLSEVESGKPVDEMHLNSGYGIVEPGVFYRDFEKATLDKNLLLPCYTASKSINTVGGMVGNNSAGEKSLTYGQTKDYVEELTAVLSNGEECVFKELTNNELEAKMKFQTLEGAIYRNMFQLVRQNYELIVKAKPSTSKNSAGYLLWEVWDKVRFNLAKLIVGSQGTLALVTKIKFRLVKPKPKSELLVIFMNDLKRLGDVVHTVVQHHPETFESFDDHTFKLAIKFLPGLLKRMKGNIITLGLQFLPEVWLTLTGGVPKLILIAEFTGETEAEIKTKMLAAQKDVYEKYGLKTHMTKSAWEAQKYWTVRRESFNLLRQHTKGLSTAPFIDDIIVHPAQLPEFLPRLNQILSKYPSLVYTIAGHAGDANFHIIPLMDLASPSERDIIPKLSDEVYNLVLEYKGSITAEHNDGLIRTPYLEKMYGMEVYDLFKQAKHIFDPQNIFNPGKKVGATLDYVMGLIKKK